MGSDLFDPVEEFRVMGEKNISVPVVIACLDGVIAGLVPLLDLVPLEDGVPHVLLSIICKTPFGGGDLDFARDSEDPATPVARDAAILGSNDIITTATMI